MESSTKGHGRASAAIESAGEELSGALTDVEVRKYTAHPSVQQAVETALDTQGDLGGGALEDLLTRNTLHYVALAAISRAATGEEPMTHEQIDGVRKFFKTIFNGLFDR